MKKFSNKKITIPVPTTNGTKDLEKTYGELIIECINNPPQGGFTVNDMQQRIKILKIAQKENKEMEFEDADFEKLRECVKNMRWKFLSENIIAFCEEIQIVK